jgi:hypothetical protein
MGNGALLAEDGIRLREVRTLAVTCVDISVLSTVFGTLSPDLAGLHSVGVLSRRSGVVLWGCRYFGDTRLLDVHLRRKVEDNPDRPSVVITIRGVGYEAGQP